MSICDNCFTGYASYNGVEFKSCMDKPCDIREKGQLFGSWVESGNEDKHLKELYKSRFNKSTSAEVSL